MEPQRTVEQIEVIEHTVTEGRRPISSGWTSLFSTSRTCFCLFVCFKLNFIFYFQKPWIICLQQNTEQPQRTLLRLQRVGLCLRGIEDSSWRENETSAENRPSSTILPASSEIYPWLILLQKNILPVGSTITDTMCMKCIHQVRQLSCN